MNYTKEDLLVILEAFIALERNMTDGQLLDRAYDLLKDKPSIHTPSSKILAINRFVICNYMEILDVVSKHPDVPVEVFDAVKKVEKKVKKIIPKSARKIIKNDNR